MMHISRPVYTNLSRNELTLGPLTSFEGLKGRVVDGDQLVEFLSIFHSLKKYKQESIRSETIYVDDAHLTTSLY